MKSGINFDSVFKPGRNLFRIVDSYDKIGSSTSLHKPYRKPLFFLTVGREKTPLVPSSFPINKSDVKIVVVTVVTGIDINIIIGVAFQHNAHIATKGFCIIVCTPAFVEHTMLIVKLAETYPRTRENKKQYENHLFHTTNIQ